VIPQPRFKVEEINPKRRLGSDPDLLAADPITTCLEVLPECNDQYVFVPGRLRALLPRPDVHEHGRLRLDCHVLDNDPGPSPSW
jgi:hypothetical protein